VIVLKYVCAYVKYLRVVFRMTLLFLSIAASFEVPVILPVIYGKLRQRNFVKLRVFYR